MKKYEISFVSEAIEVEHFHCFLPEVPPLIIILDLISWKVIDRKKFESNDNKKSKKQVKIKHEKTRLFLFGSLLTKK